MGKLQASLAELAISKSIPATIGSLDLITNAFTEMIQSIYDEKPQIKDGEVFIETLSIKIVLATKSILELTKGGVLNGIILEGRQRLIDFPSINILARSIIEAFLTLEYLFFNNLKESEKVFRFDIWRISGYKSRQNFFKNGRTLPDDIDEKLKSELIEITELLTKVEGVHFKTSFFEFFCKKGA